MGTRSGFWAAEAAFRFQLRHLSACLKFKPYHHRTVRCLDGRVDASYHVLKHSTERDYVYTEPSRSAVAGETSANRAGTRKDQSRNQGLDFSRWNIGAGSQKETEVLSGGAGAHRRGTAGAVGKVEGGTEEVVGHTGNGRGLSRLQTSGPLPTPCVGRGRGERADRTALGNCVPKADDLTDLVALRTVFFASVPPLAVLVFDALPIGAGILVVIDLTVLRRILGRVRVVRRNPCHIAGPPD